MSDQIVYPKTPAPEGVKQRIREFLTVFHPYESRGGKTLNLFLDEKSNAYYVTFHIEGNSLAKFCDMDASLEGDEEDEIYKLNREITEDQAAYKIMELDAINGRSFEDIVLEYDTSYRPKKPLKVYGGQHRLRAITKAESKKGDTLHGVRVYFNLSREQKVEIATVNNTAIAVPNDLLDRMREQLLGSNLRDWCQRSGMLGSGEDFADRRNPDTPTVRIARTLIVNFFLGIRAEKIETFHHPILCKSGGVDEDYIAVRKDIVWNDPSMLKMGQEFARLHKAQKETVISRDGDKNAEFARKALSLPVVASWGYAAGLFQRQADYLENLYSIPDNVVPPEDPFNAKALSQARLKGTDPDTYRGLGARTGPRELGRMLEVFLILAIKSKKRITKEIANAAIQSYEAKRAVHDASKVLGRI